ncbi:hypothetical protein MRX96_019659 [Rhipicephalus microplus]
MGRPVPSVADDDSDERAAACGTGFRKGNRHGRSPKHSRTRRRNPEVPRSCNATLASAVIPCRSDRFLLMPVRRRGRCCGEIFVYFCSIFVASHGRCDLAGRAYIRYVYCCGQLSLCSPMHPSSPAGGLSRTKRRGRYTVAR